jgi:enoyl-CoA hydratase/carnithine racemase
MSASILFEQRGHVGLITLNEPEKRNALTLELLDQFGDTLDAVASNPELRVVVLTGAGKGFCSGADFTAMSGLTKATGMEGVGATHEAIRAMYGRLLKLQELPQPTIAAMNGAAVGGGLALALLCDIRVASEDAKIGANFARLGIHPGLGISHLLPKIVGYQNAADLLYSGRLIRGTEAEQLGLVKTALPAEQVLEYAMGLAQEMAQSAPLSLRMIKQTLRAGLTRGMRQVLEEEALAQAYLAQTDDAKEGIMASLQRRTPDFKGK